MDVKEAARTAIRYVHDLLEDEEVTDLGLEEVEFDSAKAQRPITVGFSRPWDYERATIPASRPTRCGASILTTAMRLSSESGNRAVICDTGCWVA